MFGRPLMGPYLGARRCGWNSWKGPARSLRCHSHPTGAMTLDPADGTKTGEDQGMEEKRSKTEAELIATVANIPDAAGCLRFAERAMKQGMPALAAGVKIGRRRSSHSRRTASVRHRCPAVRRRRQQ